MKKIGLLGLLACVFAGAFGQRTWIEADVSTHITKKLQIALSPEVRFKEGLDLKEYFLESSLEYSFNKYFEIGAGYRFGYNINKKDEHESFGRFHLDAKASTDWNNFTPKFRLRYTNADDFADDNETITYLRYKLGLAYKIKKIKTSPYVVYEWYQDLDAHEISKARFEGGFQYKINKHHKVGLYYRTNKYLTDDKDTRNIIGVSYKLKI